jgi:FSR family fosmidomycin resistance protein-like MFS transporter
VNRRVLAQLSFGHLATDLSQGALPALLPLFKTRYHLSYIDVGFIVLMANISSSLIQPAFGVLSDRITMRWLMPIGSLVAGAGIVLAVHASQFTVMIAMIFLSGLGVAAFHPEGYKFAGLASGELGATGMSYFSAGGNVGFGFGPAAASVALHYAGPYGMLYILPFSVAAAVVLWRVAAPRHRERLESAWRASREDAAPSPASRAAAGTRDARRPEAASPAARAAVFRFSTRTVLMMLVSFVILRSWMSVGESSFIPLYFTGIRHLNPTYAGLMVSLFLGAGSVGTLLGGIAADRWGRRRMLLWSMLILPPLLWAMPRAVGPAAMAASLAAGMAAVSTFAVVMVMAQSIIPERIGLISGLMIGFAVGTGGIGTTLLGAIADRWGVLRALDVTALLPLAAFAIALLLPPDPPAAARESRPVWAAAHAAADKPGEAAARVNARNREAERARTAMGCTRSDAAGGR